MSVVWGKGLRVIIGLPQLQKGSVGILKYLKNIHCIWRLRCLLPDFKLLINSQATTMLVTNMTLFLYWKKNVFIVYFHFCIFLFQKRNISKVQVAYVIRYQLCEEKKTKSQSSIFRNMNGWSSMLKLNGDVRSTLPAVLGERWPYG